MTADAVQSLVDRLPAAQRDKAKARVLHALKYQWSYLDLMGEGPQWDVADLVGVSPGGNFEFLKDCFED